MGGLVTEQSAGGRFNRQEAAYLLLFATLLLLAVLLLVGLLWLLLPYRLLPTAGNVADFPPAEHPYAARAGEKALFIVNTGEEIVAFDRRTPTADFRRCLYVWVPVNTRFEDPCSGSKFSLTGDYIEGWAARNLDRYPVVVRQGQILVDVYRPVAGKPVLEHKDP
jgi:cytochrome b6-f complex iron-sulfur subunit